MWFTLDAGPNPVLLTDAAHEVRAEALARECGARRGGALPCRAATRALIGPEHLF